MGSMSESEGEIIESREVSKAITAPAPTYAKDRPIDRRSYSTSTSASNTPRQSVEPNNTANGRHANGKHTNGRRNHTDRSPSPYRHERGEKRRRGHNHTSQGDTHDQRHRDDRRPRSYQDLDQPTHYGGLNYDEGRQPSRYDRERKRDREPDMPPQDRNRSRSPWRPGKGSKQAEPVGRHDDKRRPRDENVRPESKDPKSREFNKHLNQNQDRGGDRHSKRVKFDQATAAGHVINENARKGSASAMDIDEPVAPAEPIDEDAEIERRRKERQAKRKALLNKTKPSALLTQALHIPTATDSTPATPPIDTPSRDSRQATPVIGSPATPRPDSAPNSPMFAMDLEKELERVQNEITEEPSAALYDPSDDVDDDRARHEAERTHNIETSASTYDETNDTEHKDVLIPQTSEESEKPKATAGDMFADESDDDDDMFSAKAPKLSSATEAVDAQPQGRVLAADLHDNWDTPDGFYKTIVGELIDNRYMVTASLGKGVFATVIRAQDSQAKKSVAIKIVRNNEAMRKAGVKEIDILTTLAQADAEDMFHIVRLERHFVHKNHLCMVFEHLGHNLRDLVKNFGRKTGLEMQIVRSYAVQMFKALVLMRKCEILHADLKPDNILSDAAQGKKIKIADLGSATAASDNEITPYLASRFYRAPEVMLGIPPSYPIDMWAIGCTLFELFTDAILFAGKSNNDMLKVIQESRGKISKKVIRRGAEQFKFAHFDAQLDLFGSVERAGNPPKDTVRWITFGSQPAPGKDIKTRLLRAANKKGTTTPAHLKELEEFKDLLDKCLKLDPDDRITPRQALAHKFCAARPALPAKVTVKH